MESSKAIVAEGRRLFSSRLNLLSLWQEIAEHFYPEKADFTTVRVLGSEFADHLSTSNPVIMRMELGNTLAAMLRPEIGWFSISTDNYKDLDMEAKRWLEWATGVQRRAMYDRKALFVKATKEGDHDFVTFGQCVISREVDLNTNTLLFRCWHLRDVAWDENDRGEIDTIFRQWKPKARELARIFGEENISSEVKSHLTKAPETEIPCMHAVLSKNHYEYLTGEKVKTAFMSVFIEVNTGKILKSQPSNDRIYTIPRWQTVSGSQYAYSPSTMVGLPDARLLQTMTLSILEAGEKIANPPYTAVEGAIRSDIALYAGGTTWIDKEYDTRTGDPLKPLRLDVNGLNVGMEMASKIKEDLYKLFYLNKVSLPPMVGEVTTFEISQRIKEYTRQALPLFEPVSSEYNGELCEGVFNLLLRVGAFGSPQDIPKSLQGNDVIFRFESPLRTAEEKQKPQIFMQAKAMVESAAALDPKALAVLNIEEAVRDSIDGLDAPKAWLRSTAEMEQLMAEKQKQIQQQQMLQALQQSSQIAESAGRAATYFKESA